ncbi:hypothetical protein LOK49_LG03G01401 [Camellia lanceoleosa]|uniref:Uncharacterized protein n=1 Tax=Camellia lanceoleosa TaxID=1840588 RepID=A0ACC0I8A0_9ERIC|nr:hypothetical protein LOK49_LG03G01401 [Camellia lanceoleosa]
MTITKDEDPVVFYAPIPTNPDNSNQNYVVLPLYPHPHRRRSHNHHHHRYPSLSRCVGVAAAFLLLSTAAFLLYPSDPHLSLARLHLNHIQILTSPQLSLDLSLSHTPSPQSRLLLPRLFFCPCHNRLPRSSARVRHFQWRSH